MVTVTTYHIRQNKVGKSFIALELQGDIELVQSSETGRFYATAKRCSITSTFTEEVAQTLIGKQMPGVIQKVDTTPYEFTIPETGEVIMLEHTYQYMPEEQASSRMLRAA